MTLRTSVETTDRYRIHTEKMFAIFGCKESLMPMESILLVELRGTT